MPELLIRIKRGADGSAALTCVRADGSRTWQKQPGALGSVFPAHDLTHYVVESTLGYRHGFYGLVADGWDISDFAAPWPRGPIPAEAREVELVVGMLDMERMSGAQFSATEFAEHAARYVAASRAGQHGLHVPPLTDDELARLRAARADALARWAAVPAGGTLELAFDR